MENQQATALCKGECGFFGSSATEGLCSKCYKDSIQGKQDTARVSASKSNALDALAKIREAAKNVPELAAQLDDVAQSLCTCVSPASSSSNVAPEVLEPAAILPSPAEGVAAAASSVPDKKVNRCQVCNKRVGLIGFGCRCGGLFCAEHRYDSAHGCDFDYKTMEREEIRKNNPLVVCDKIQRI